MSEEIFPADFGDQLARTFRQTMGSLTELMEEKFEYQLIGTIDLANELAREGWTLHSAPSPVTYIMQRKLGAADAAAELLRQAGRIMPPSTPGHTPDNSHG
jgi:hypothetical protein